MATAESLPPPYRLPSKTVARQFRRRRDVVSPTSSEESLEKQIYQSPRIDHDDERLFPKIEALHKKEERWKYISEQAGSHRQDGSVLTLNRSVTPKALRAGITPQVACRVKHLNLWLDHTEDILPEWLDVISTLFINLEHLTLSEDIFAIDEENAVSSRMRRLYVLYRLPDLKSIDDMAVTNFERRLARPNDPNGERVDRKDWVKCTTHVVREEDFGEVAKVDSASSEEVESSDASTISDLITATRSEDVTSSPEEEGEELVVPVDFNGPQSSDGEEVLVGDVKTIESTPIPLVEITGATDGSGEQREDKSSNNNSRDDRQSVSPVREVKQSKIRVETKIGYDDAIEVDLCASVRSQLLSSPESLRVDTLTDDSDDVQPITRIKRAASQLRKTASQATDCESKGHNRLSSTEPMHGSPVEHQKDDPMEVSPSSQVEASASDENRGDLDACSITQNTMSKSGEGHVLDTMKISLTDSEDSTTDGEGHESATPAISPRDLNRTDTIDLISVASSHHEWTAACGALSFGTRRCAPTLRLPFCGQGRKPNTTTLDEAKDEAKRAFRLNCQKRLPMPSPIVKPITVPPSPHFGTEVVRDGSFGYAVKFFPETGLSQRHSNVPAQTSDSSTKRIPPSKSLTSPFPMQFRQRSNSASPLRISTNQTDDLENNPVTVPTGPKGSSAATPMETIASPIPLNRVSSFPVRISPSNKSAAKGELPPPCPGPRKLVVTSFKPLKSRKTKRHMRRMKEPQRNVRSTAMFDADEEDESEDEEDDILKLLSDEPLMTQSSKSP